MGNPSYAGDVTILTSHVKTRVLMSLFHAQRRSRAQNTAPQATHATQIIAFRPEIGLFPPRGSPMSLSMSKTHSSMSIAEGEELGGELASHGAVRTCRDIRCPCAGMIATPRKDLCQRRRSARGRGRRKIRTYVDENSRRAKCPGKCPSAGFG